MDPLGLIFLGIGLFSALGGALEWGFFMNHRKALFMQRVLGRNGARLFYIVLGLALATYGSLVLGGVLGTE